MSGQSSEPLHPFQAGTHPELAFTYPAAVPGIPVDQRCQALNFLHAYGWDQAGQSRAGEYIVHYADGAQQIVPLVIGENIANLYAPTPPTVSRQAGATVAWTRNGNGSIRL